MISEQTSSSLASSFSFCFASRFFLYTKKLDSYRRELLARTGLSSTFSAGSLSAVSSAGSGLLKACFGFTAGYDAEEAANDRPSLCVPLCNCYFKPVFLRSCSFLVSISLIFIDGTSFTFVSFLSEVFPFAFNISLSAAFVSDFRSVDYLLLSLAWCCKFVLFMTP